MTVGLQLLERSAERNPRRFAELYDLYADKIYKYFYYTARTRSDAQDLTARVLSQVRERIEGNRLEGEPLATWLYSLAHRKLSGYCRAYHLKGIIANLLIIESGDDLPVTAEHPCTTSQIHAAMQHLTLAQKEVIVLRFLEDYNAAQVAVIMNIGPDAVRVIQQDALQALEPWLGDETSCE